MYMFMYNITCINTYMFSRVLVDELRVNVDAVFERIHIQYGIYLSCRSGNGGKENICLEVL